MTENRVPTTEKGRALLAQFRSRQARTVKDYPVHWLDAADIVAIEDEARDQPVPPLDVHLESLDSLLNTIQSIATRRMVDRASHSDEMAAIAYAVKTTRKIVLATLHHLRKEDASRPGEYEIDAGDGKTYRFSGEAGQ